MTAARGLWNFTLGGVGWKPRGAEAIHGPGQRDGAWQAWQAAGGCRGRDQGWSRAVSPHLAEASEAGERAQEPLSPRLMCGR